MSLFEQWSLFTVKQTCKAFYTCLSFKNKCGNKTVQDNFGVVTENVPCGSTGTTCSKTVRIQLGVRSHTNNSAPVFCALLLQSNDNNIN